MPENECIPCQFIFYPLQPRKKDLFRFFREFFQFFSMARRAAETNVFQFQRDIVNIYKYNESLAINDGSQLMICSPFKTTRPLSGLHVELYSSKTKISRAGHVFFDARFLAEYLGEEYPFEFIKESFYLVLDKTGEFTLLDSPRAIIMSHFRLNLSDPIIDFTGHPVNLGEFVVLTRNMLYAVKILFDSAEILFSVPVENAQQIEPYQNGFLVLDSRGIGFLVNKEYSIVYPSEKHISEIRVCQHVIAAAINVNSHNYKIQIIGGQSFGLANMCPHCWDITNGYIIALHDNGASAPQSISFTRVDATSRRASITLTNHVNDPISLFAASSSYVDTLVVIVFTNIFALTTRVPLAELRT